MHILFITADFPPDSTAAAARCMEHAALWVDSGHQVTVVTGMAGDGALQKPGMAAIDTIDGVDVLRVWVPGATAQPWRRGGWDGVMFAAMLFSQSWRLPPVDLVLASGPPFWPLLSGHLLAQLRHIPFIAEVRHLPEAMRVGSPKGIWARAKQWLLGRILQRASGVVTVSKPLVGHLRHRFSVPSARLHQIGHGLHPNWFIRKGHREATRKSHGWEGRSVVLYVGNHSAANQLHVLLDAAEQLQESHPEILFALVGDGKAKPELEQNSQQRWLSNVAFYDTVPREEMASLYEGADLFVLSLRGEGRALDLCPPKLLEAMAMRLPVVVSAEGASADLVSESGAGVAVKPGDGGGLAEAVTALLAQPEQMERMGSKGRDYIEVNCRRSGFAGQYLALMHQLVNGNRLRG